MFVLKYLCTNAANLEPPVMSTNGHIPEGGGEDRCGTEALLNADKPMASMSRTPRI